MKKLCVVDMNFTWPPDGGAPIDLSQTLVRWAHFYEVTLLVPRVTKVSQCLGQPWPLRKTKFFLRGQIATREAPPYRQAFLDFDLLHFTPSLVAGRVQAFVESMGADAVIVADSWYFKPAIVRGLQNYRPILFLFAHEMMCLKGNGLMYRRHRVCDVNYLGGGRGARITCATCACGFYLTYPSPRWIYECVAAKAFGEKYQKDCLEAFSFASAVVVKNQGIANRLSPFVPGKLIVAPPGIDTHRFVPVERPKEHGDVFRFLVTGRLNMENKGLRVVLQAAKSLWNERQDFRVLVTHTKTMKGVPFVTKVPWQPYEEVHKVYQGVNVLLFPSLWPEPFGMVAEEAMACGIPVIGSRVGGIPDIVVEGITGFLVPPGDVKALQHRMNWCLEHREEVAQMGKRARERAVLMFDSDRVFENHYKDLVA